MSNDQTTSTPGNGQNGRQSQTKPSEPPANEAETRGVAIDAAREALRAVPGAIVVSPTNLGDINESLDGMEDELRSLMLCHCCDSDDGDLGPLARIAGQLHSVRLSLRSGATKGEADHG